MRSHHSPPPVAAAARGSHRDRPRSDRHTPPHENVLQRLQRRTEEARRLGFEVRAEYLDGPQATWCQLGSRRIIFIDLSQTAAEQLQQLNETLATLPPAS